MNNLNLIIFDLDGTLYYLEDVIGMNYQMQLDFYASYTGKSKVDSELTFEQNGIYPIVNEKSRSATEFFSKSGIPAKEWNSYRERHFDVMAIHADSAVKCDVVQSLSRICPLVILSSNSSGNIYQILNHINIPVLYFEEIICSDNQYGLGAFRKKEEMRLLTNRRNIPAESVLSIGDRYKTDIEPMLELGGRGILVNGPIGVTQFSNDYCGTSPLSNKNYSYFGGLRA